MGVSYSQVVCFVGSGSVHVCKAIFVHDPIGLDAPRSLSSVEHECLLDTKSFGAADGLVGPSGLPVASSGGTVGTGAIRVLTVPRGKEIPLLLTQDGQFWKMRTI